MPAGRPWDYLNPQHAGMRSAAARGARPAPARYAAPQRAPDAPEPPATPSSDSQTAGQVLSAIAPFANFIPTAGPGIAAGLRGLGGLIPAADVAAQTGSARDVGNAVLSGVSGAAQTAGAFAPEPTTGVPTQKNPQSLMGELPGMVEGVTRDGGMGSPGWLAGQAGIPARRLVPRWQHPGQMPQLGPPWRY